MSEQFVFAKTWGNRILYRGIKNGDKVIEKVEDFKPKFHVKSKNKKTIWRSIYGDPLDEISFASIKDAKEFAETYKDVAGFEVHGNIEFHYQYLASKFKGELSESANNLDTWFIDIETIDVGENYGGFPDIQQANFDIVLISVHIKNTNKTIVFGCRDITKKNPKFEYRNFATEQDMLKAFILFWQQERFPEIISGWNISSFDVPYLINRIVREIGEDWAKKLSPFNMITERVIQIRGKDVQTYDIVGVVELDYLDLYKKFGSYSQKESYALGAIAQEELGETKLENPGKNFHDFWKNYYDTFVEYNARDSELVHKLDDKMKLIELAVSVAYLAKCNIRDALGVVKMWDVFIYNHLQAKNIAIPPQKKKVGGEFDGAYVKDVIPGMYGWTMTFDFSSLYPTIMRQWNISPEQLHSETARLTVDDFVKATRDSKEVWAEYAKEINCTVAANGTMYSRDKTGIIPEVATIMVEGRKTAKKEMIRLEKEYQANHDASLLPRIAALHNRQLALKIAANALYGAVTNVGFRYYDLRMGEAITLTGQASNRHLERSLNEYMNKVLKTSGVEYAFYGDTDSNFLNVDQLVKKVCAGKSIKQTTKFLDKFGEHEIQKVIDESIDIIFTKSNGFSKLMGSKREAIASKCIFTTKKRYAMMVHNSEGVDYDPYKLKIMGLDIIKSSTPKWVRERLKNALPIMFEQGQTELIRFVVDTYNDFLSAKIEDISFPKSVNDIDKWESPSEYCSLYKKGTPIHVRAAILYNSIDGNAGTIRNKDKIKFAYLRMPNPIRENIIGFPAEGKVPEHLVPYVDRELQWEKVFISPLKGLTDAIKWKIEESTNLEDFF